MSAADSLDAYLDQQHGPEGVDTEHWTITDAGGAEWALRKLGRLHRQMGENDSIAKEDHRMIDEWRAERNAVLEREANNFLGLLASWHQKILADDPERKTVSYPHGTLKARKLPDHWEFGDEFKEWAKVHRPELVRLRTVCDVEKTTAKQALEPVSDECVVDTASGEKVPGVLVTKGEVKFTVDTLGGLR